MYGKQHKLTFGQSKHIKAKCGEYIHSDLCGPMSVSSVNGARYFVLFKDDYSGYRVVFFIKHKDDTLECFKEFVKLSENKKGNPVKVLHVDNGREYCGKEFRSYLSSQGIELETTAPYTPEQNGRSERDMRTIVESARSMLYARDVPLYLWAEAVNTAVYILNRTATSQAPDTTPLEMWTGKTPTLDHIRTFGCDAYMHVPKELRNKLAPKSKKLMLVGYDGNSTNYRLYDVETKKIKVSRNVSFNEGATITEEKKNFVRISHDEDDNENTVSDENERQSKKDDSITDTKSGGYSLRIRDSIKKPIRYEAHFADIQIPEKFEEAMKSREKVQWQEAIQEEIDALKTNKTWNITFLSEGKHAIRSKWVFSIKANNNIKNMPRFKARLCAKGYAQRKGVDYTDTFSPTARYDSIRILLALAVQQDLKMKQFDVKTTFLNGELHDEVYMFPPEGIEAHMASSKRLVNGMNDSMVS